MVDKEFIDKKYELCYKFINETRCYGISGRDSMLADSNKKLGFIFGWDACEKECKEKWIADGWNARDKALRGTLLPDDIKKILDDKSCSHGILLDHRCFKCDPNTGTENRK